MKKTGKCVICKLKHGGANIACEFCFSAMNFVNGQLPRTSLEVRKTAAAKISKHVRATWRAWAQAERSAQRQGGGQS
jgi:hypothetical protein